MSIRALVQRLIDAGVEAAEAAAIIAEAAILGAAQSVDPVAEKRRAYDRQRKRRNSAESGGTPVESGGIPPETAEPLRTCAQVVNPSSSLRSEEIPPPNPIGLGAPKGAETMRGSRLPDDWRPPESIDPHDFGMTDHEYADQAARFRDYWRAVPGAKGRKSDWPATWRNWLRRAADNRTQRRNERPDPLDKLTAREANHARALAGADIAARQRWEP